ncbi:MAG: hypothetical protein ACP5VE_04195 [Chthonomonadales bacterium]
MEERWERVPELGVELAEVAAPVRRGRDLRRTVAGSNHRSRQTGVRVGVRQQAALPRRPVLVHPQRRHLTET